MIRRHQDAEINVWLKHVSRGPLGAAGVVPRGLQVYLMKTDLKMSPTYINILQILAFAFVINKIRNYLQ
jgi:hypothetical protein